MRDRRLHDETSVDGVHFQGLLFTAEGFHRDDGAGGVGVHFEGGAEVLNLVDADHAEGFVDGLEGVGFAPSPAVIHAVVFHQGAGLLIVAGGGEEDVAYLVDGELGVGLQKQSHNARNGGARHGGAAHLSPEVALPEDALHHTGGVGVVGPCADGGDDVDAGGGDFGFHHPVDQGAAAAEVGEVAKDDFPVGLEAVAGMGGHSDALGGAGGLADAIEGVAAGESGVLGNTEGAALVAGMVVLVGEVPGVDGATGGGDVEVGLHEGLADIELDVGTVVEDVAVLYHDAVGHALVAALEGVVDGGVAVGGAIHGAVPEGAVVLPDAEAGGEVVSLLAPHDEHLSRLADAVYLAGADNHGAQRVDGVVAEVAAYVEGDGLAAVVAAAGDEHRAGVRPCVDGLAEERGAVDGAEGVHAPAAVDDQSARAVLSHLAHPFHTVHPCCLAEAEGAEEQVGVGGLADVLAVVSAAGADAGHVGAVGAVAVEVRRVALGGEEVTMAADEGAVVEALRSGACQAEMVPCHIQAEVVAGHVVVVGVRIVEAPVGDADVDIFAGEGGVRGPFQAEAVLHAVRAGVEARTVALLLGNLVRDAVLQHLLVALQQGQGLHGDAHGHYLSRLGAKGDASLLEHAAVEPGNHFRQHADAGGTAGNLFGHEGLRIYGTLLLLRLRTY